LGRDFDDVAANHVETETAPKDAGVRRRTFGGIFKDRISERAEMGLENLVAARAAEFGDAAVPVSAGRPSFRLERRITSSA
jgi:hypothetical protein